MMDTNQDPINSHLMFPSSSIKKNFLFVFPEIRIVLIKMQIAEINKMHEKIRMDVRYISINI